MSLISVYARKERTTDPLLAGPENNDRMDIVIYRDKECTKVFVRYPWYFSDKPRRNTRKITLNCWYWNLVWC